MIPEPVARALAYFGILAAAFCFGLVKGCEHERDKWEAATAVAQAAADAESARRRDKQREADGQHRAELAQARTDAAGARDAHRRLLDAIRAGQATGNPAAAAGSAPANPLGELLGECAARHRDLAAEADLARAAGQLCERYYDALTAPAATNRARVRNFLKGTPP